MENRQIPRKGIGAIACALVLLSAGPGWAQEKYRFDHSTPPQTTRYVQQHVLDVGDMPGHQVRLFEYQRTYTEDLPVISGIKVVESRGTGASDYVNGVGPVSGYEIWTLEDKNLVFMQFTGTSYSEATASGSRRGTFHGTGRFIGGTGKFAALRGSLTETLEFDTDPQTGYNRPVNHGEYWFED